MGSKLTPRKIDRLMKIATDDNLRQFMPRDYLGKLSEQQIESITAGRPLRHSEYKSSGEISSGILDLDQCEGFGDSCGVVNISAAFNPGEMTGRSTEAESIRNLEINDTKAMLHPSIDNMEVLVDKQTSDINELMRHSIASEFASEFATRNLTEAEESFMAANCDISNLPNKRDLNITCDSNQKDLDQIYNSYFSKRSEKKPFLQAVTPDANHSRVPPNLLKGELFIPRKEPEKQTTMDISLDNVPVRQPRPTTTICKPVDNPPVLKPTTDRKPTATESNPVVNKSYKNPLFANPTKQHLHGPVNEESSQDDVSFSISAIENYLMNQKDMRLSNAMKQVKRDVKHPLQEINNIIYNQYSDNNHVSMLKDKRTDTGSSSSSTNTVISVEKKSNLENIPEITVTKEGKVSLPLKRSEWPKSARSPSPCSVQENLVSTSYRSESPNRSTVSRVSMVEEWAEIKVEPVTGFVGITTDVTITVNTITSSWLTASLEFNTLTDNELTMELPQFPIDLPPKSSTKIVVSLKPNCPIRSTLQFYLKLKEMYGYLGVEQIGKMEVNIKLPAIQTITNEGKDCAIKFPTTQENTVLRKFIVLTSECTSDLLLDLVLLEGAGAFSISQVQEINKNEIMYGFPEISVGSSEERRPMRQANTRTCNIPADGAARVMLTFTATQLSDLQLESKKAVFRGLLGIYIKSSGIILRKIDICASVGTVDLVVELSTNTLHINDGAAVIKIGNMGSIPGKWVLKFKEESNQYKTSHFQVCTNVLELNPGVTTALKIRYVGPEDKYNESNLLFEDTMTKKVTMLQISAGHKVQKSFPIKTTLGEMCWVRDGRKDINLRNYSDTRITVKCKIVGNGFYMETSKANCTDLLLMFAPNESKTICVIFKATSVMPHKGKLLIFMDNDNEMRKNVRLHACAAGYGANWSGMLTYGGTALLKAIARQPLHLTLKNTSLGPAFISVAARFNLQYTIVQTSSSLRGDRAVIAGQSSTRVTLMLDWSRVEKIASDAGGEIGTVVTLHVLTGSEYTRQRILRILKEDANCELAASKLPEHLKRLTGTFEGEDSRIGEALRDFQETTRSLDVLLGGIKELTAQVDLPEDFGECTICLTEDTILEHHTLCD